MNQTKPKGSLFLTRPKLGDYVVTKEEMVARSEEVFNWVRQGIMDLQIDSVLPLKDAATAHQLLEGSSVLSLSPLLIFV